jgi:transcriptional regulator with XRE-family HTH domain
MNIRHRVAHNIKDLRRFRGLSQEALAVDSGVSRAHMGRLENGAHSATLDTVETIAKTLRVDPILLFLPRRFSLESRISFATQNGGYIDLSQS